jgi:hydrogenase-4 membrane subunit HyfE
MSETQNAVLKRNRKALRLILVLVAVAGIILAIVMPSPSPRKADRKLNAPLATAMLVGAMLVDYFWHRRKRAPRASISENPISD